MVPGTGGASAGGAGGALGGAGGGAVAPDGGSAPEGGLCGAGAGGAGGNGSYPPPLPPTNPNCVPSKLYGKNGELWKPDGRLIDAGWAGYRNGMAPIPNVEGPVKKVTDFGAKGDDEADDTQAFVDALAGTPSGVLLIPAGRYILTKQLFFRTGNLVFRGEGPGKSVLYFPRPLTEVGVGGTSWSFNGGFLSVAGTDPGAVIGTVTANVARGATEIPLSATAGVKAGDFIRIQQTDVGGALLRALYGGQNGGNTGEDGGTQVFTWYSPVAAVGANSITLVRTFPFEINTAWKPTVTAAAPTVRELGIEGLTLEMAKVPYPGHFNERGYNGIYMVGAFDSWVRNVEIINAELGISIYRSYFVTVTDVVLDGNTGATIGHHGLNSARGADVLFTRFELKQKYVHDLTVDGYAFGTVWSKGKGVDLNMDHHGRAPYGTLWTELDLGRGGRPFASGGAGNRLPGTGAYTTVWNIAGAGLPAGGLGPLMNIVGTGGSGGPASWSVEDIKKADLCQPNLYEAMLDRRRK